MLRVFRVCRREHSPADPTGATLTPGRWNLQGQAVLYAASSFSLALLEFRARNVPFKTLRFFYPYCTLDLPSLKNAVEQVDDSRWFREGRTLALQVRSAVTRLEFNYIVNTLHPFFRQVKISPARPLDLDPRLL